MERDVRQMRELLHAGDVVVLLLRPLAEPAIFRVCESQDPRAARVQPVSRFLLRVAFGEPGGNGSGCAFVIRRVGGIWREQNKEKESMLISRHSVK